MTKVTWQNTTFAADWDPAIYDSTLNVEFDDWYNNDNLSQINFDNCCDSTIVIIDIVSYIIQP